LLCAADWLSTNDQSPTLMVGHSLGGAAVLAASAKIDSVKAVATIAAPSEPNHIAAMFSDQTDEIRRVGKADVEIAGRAFEISKQFIDDIEGYSLLKQVESLRRALLVFHSPQDAIVGIEHAASIFNGCKASKKFRFY